MAAKKDPLKAKQAKQKKLAIGGGVLLLALLAFQVPRTMKMLHPAGNVTTSASTAPATTTPGATPLAPPTLDGSSGSTASAPAGNGTGSATSADGVVDASTPLPASSGQLVSFNRFKTKDPFVQQVQDCTSGACSGASTAAPASASTSPAGTSSGSGASGAAAPTASAGAGGSGQTGSPLKATKASISVNGVVSKVAVGKTFPAGNPVFALASLTTKAAKIAISGGSLQGGAATVTLGLGKTLKLQNTADGALYTLTLVSTSG